ncbi:hypothetical protein SDJN03_25690, partial [Cucurbita argyrosperma subsp. sororia]
MSNGSRSSEEEEPTSEQINEELEAIARSAGSDEDESADDSGNDTLPVENGYEEVNFELISATYADTLVSVLINGAFPLGAWQDITNHLLVGLAATGA